MAVITIAIITIAIITLLELLELDHENFLARYVCPRVGWPGHLFLIGNAVRLSQGSTLCALRLSKGWGR